VEGTGQQSRTCWWEDDEHFAIQSEHPSEDFRSLLYQKASRFLERMEWKRGLSGVEHGILVSENEFGVNPFVALSGDSNENTPLKCFSARVVPDAILPRQVGKLKTPASCEDWLHQLDRGASRRWGFDCRVNADA